MNNVLIWIGVVAAAILAMLFGGPYLVDWNAYRDEFESHASRLLGREVRVQGDINLRLLPMPYIEAEKVWVADKAPAEDRPAGNREGRVPGEALPLFETSKFTMWLAVPPLLRGEVEAQEVTLKHPRLRLSVNREGRGNWRTLSVDAGALPFLPAKVSLQSVKITKGTLVLEGPEGERLLEATGINGQLSAESLGGPFRFNGSALWEGNEREVRLSTAEVEGAGTVRFKAFVRAANTGNEYALDGVAASIMENPRVSGSLVTRIARPFQGGTAVSGATSAPIEIRGQVEAAWPTFALRDLALTFDSAGQPQIVSGEALAAWRPEGPPRLDVTLSARWLDVDRIALIPAGASPLVAAGAVIGALMGEMPAAMETTARFSLDQVSLGGEALSGLEASLRQGKEGPLRLERFAVGLPGGAHLNVAGDLPAGPGGKVGAFTGTVALRGANLGRFLNWAFPAPLDAGRLDAGKLADGPFSVQGVLRVTLEGAGENAGEAGENVTELTEATAELGGQAFAGRVRYEGGSRRLEISVEGQNANLERLWPGFDSSKAAVWLYPDKGEREGKGPGTARLVREAVFDVRFAELAFGEEKLQGVRARFSRSEGRTSISHLAFETASGLVVEAGGSLPAASARTEAKAGEKTARTELRWTVEAGTPAAMSSLARLMGFVSPLKPETRLAETLAPLRLAGNIAVSPNGGEVPEGEDPAGGKAGDVALLSWDGAANGGRMQGTARLEAAGAEWGEGILNAALTLESPQAAAFAHALAGLPPPPGRDENTALGEKEPGRDPRPSPPPPSSMGRFSAVVAGRPALGLAVAATVEAPGLKLVLENGLTAPLSEGLRLKEGVADVAAEDAREVLALAGIVAPPGPGRFQAAGRFAFSHEGQTAKVKIMRFSAGGASLTGTAAFERAAEGRVKFSANLAAPEVFLEGALSPFLGKGPPAEGAALEAEGRGEEGAGTPPWPVAAFDFSALEGLEGVLRLETGRFAAGNSLGFGTAVIEAQFSPQKVAVTRLSGSVPGGKGAATLTLEKNAGSVTLKGTLEIAGFELAALDPSRSGHTVSGQADLTLGFSSQAPSPAALLRALSGEGAITLKDVRLSGFTPEGIGAALDPVIQGRAPAKGPRLLRALQEGLKSGELVLGSRRVPLRLADGSATLENITAETPRGRTTAKIVADLAALRADAEWLIEAKAFPGGGPPFALPPLSAVYVGPLATLGILEARLPLEAFERELAVRRLERDAERLEQLRRQDETHSGSLPRKPAVLPEAQRPAASPPASGSNWAPVTVPSRPPPFANKGKPAPAGSQPAAAPRAANTPSAAIPGNAGAVAPPVRAQRRPTGPFNSWDDLNAIQN